jgi:alditol oxidase
VPPESRWRVDTLTRVSDRFNWAGNVRFSASSLLRPRTVPEVQQMVASSPRIHALGTGHSFSVVADSPAGTQITLEDLARTVEVDSAAGRARVAAAVRYSELAPALDKAGFAVPNLASLPHITVAGAVATGTHGSGNRNRCLSAAVRALELVTASGELVTVTDTDAAVVALGALGVVTSLTLDLVESFEVRQWVYDNLPLASLEDRFEEIFGSAYSVSAFTTWRDPGVFDQLWVKHRADDGFQAPTSWQGAVLASGQRHPVPGMPADYTTVQSGVPGAWHERLPHFRAEFTPSAGTEIQTEYLLGRSDAVAALSALAPLATRIAPLLQVCEVRTVAADSLWLSPAYGRDTVGIHFTWLKEPAAVAALLPDIEAALAQFGPRPHWGKLFAGAPAYGAYPRAADFADLVRRYDPEGKFGNALTPE